MHASSASLTARKWFAFNLQVQRLQSCRFSRGMSQRIIHKNKGFMCSREQHWSLVVDYCIVIIDKNRAVDSLVCISFEMALRCHGSFACTWSTAEFRSVRCSGSSRTGWGQVEPPFARILPKLHISNGGSIMLLDILRSASAGVC